MRSRAFETDTTTAGPAPHRIARVIVTRANGKQYRGSGYRITPGAVLTAAHVLKDAARVEVRFDVDQDAPWSATAQKWCDVGTELAVVMFDPPERAPRVAAARYGRLPSRLAEIEVHTVGFPLWKRRRRPDGSEYRESHHAVGTVALLSNQAQATLEIALRTPPRDEPDKSPSPWEGMSGAAVWANDVIIGVVDAHHRPEGPGHLTAIRIDRCRQQAGSRPELDTLLGIPDGADLVDVRPAASPRGDADGQAQLDYATQFAKHVQRQWTDEHEQHQLHPPYSLPVRWSPALPKLADHWHNICGGTTPEDPGPLGLAGRGDEIVETYDRIPSGRLVVLGEEGSGKTVLVQRLLLKLLDRPSDQIPVIFALRSWNPETTELKDWLTDQLTTHYTALKQRTPAGKNLARELIENWRVLPILDGLDEMASNLRAKAIKRLDIAKPLILTSKTTEYRAAVRAAGPLATAAAITVTDIHIEDLVEHLPRSEWKITNPDQSSVSRWMPVLSQMMQENYGPEIRAVREALSTPLMIGLAREIYRDDDPAELLSMGRLGGADAVKRHLLGAFVPKIYNRRLTTIQQGYRRSRRQWHAEDQQDLECVLRWLTTLAHLGAKNEPGDVSSDGIAWWKLHGSVPRGMRVLFSCLFYGTAAALMAELMYWLFLYFGGHGATLAPFVIAPACIIGVAGGFMSSWKDEGLEPVQTRLKISGQAGKAIKTFAVVFVFAKPMLLPVKPLLLAIGGWPLSFALGTLPSLALAFSIASTLALLRFVEVPANLNRTSSPYASIIASRRSLALRSLVVVVTCAIGFGGVFWAFGGFGAGLVAAGLMLPGRLAYVMTSTAWGKWCMTARPYLALTGRLPWHLLDFLDDAHCRGVLRQVGPIYQFRHEQLRLRLVGHEGSSQ